MKVLSLVTAATFVHFAAMAASRPGGEIGAQPATRPGAAGGGAVQAVGSYPSPKVDKGKWGDLELVLELPKARFESNEAVPIRLLVRNAGRSTIRLDGILPMRSSANPPYLDIEGPESRSIRVNGEDCILEAVRNEKPIVLEPNVSVILIDADLRSVPGHVREADGRSQHRRTLGAALTDGNYAIRASFDPTPQVYWVRTPKALFTIGGPRAATQPAADLFGDPLPARAIARMGTIRLRNPFGAPIAFSSDGKKLAASVSHGDVRIRIWETETGKELATVPISEKVGVTAIAFLPGRDVLAWVNGTGALVLCDATTGKEASRFQTAVRGDVRMAVSPDGNLAALASSEVSLWDLSTGKRVHTLAKWTGSTACVAYSPDGRRIAAGPYSPAQKETFVHVFDAASGQEVARHPCGPRTPGALAFSPDSNTLAVGTRGDLQAGGNGVILLDHSSGKLLGFLRHAAEQIRSVSWSPDGNTVAAYGWPGNIHVWDVAGGGEIRRLGRYPTQGGDIAFSPDGKILAASEGGAIHLWEPATGKERFSDRGHTGWVNGVAVSPDGRTVATCAADGEVRLWSLPSGKPAAHVGGHAMWAASVAFSPDGRVLASGSQDGTVRVWDASTGEPVQSLAKKGWLMRSVRFSPAGDRILATSGEKGLACWQWPGGEEVGPVAVGFTGMQYRELSPDGSLVAGQPYDSRDLIRSSPGPAKPLVVIGVADKRTLLELDGGDGFAMPCCFNPQGDLLACRRGEGVSLVELSSGSEVLKHAPCQAVALAFSPDGRRLASAEKDFSIRVLNAVTGGELCLLVGHRAPVNNLDFSRDGNVLVSGGSDTTALAWSLAGLDDAPAAAPREKTLEDLWAELAGDDAAKAYAAIWALADFKDKAVRFVADRLRPQECDANRVRALVQKLGDARYAARQGATDELRKLADAAEPLLREELKAARDEETRQRLRELLESVESPKAATPAVLRKARAVGVLERIGGAEASAALEAASRGATPAWVRARARAALERLAGGKPPQAGSESRISNKE